MMLAVRGPFPWPQIAAYLSLRSTPGQEEVSGQVYRRQVADGVLTAEFQVEGSRLEVTGPGREPSPEEIGRLSTLFQFQTVWTVPDCFVKDPVLGPKVIQTPGFRPLGCWEPFELCLRTIIGQQVSVAAARTLMTRLGQKAGGWTPDLVAGSDLVGLGMPGSRIKTLKGLAQAAAEGRLPWSSPWPELREALARLPGFGPWTLDYLGIRLGRDLDAFPSSDLGLLRGVGATTPRELERRAEVWRPYRGWAASYLWME